MAIVHRISRLALVSHRVWIAHIDCSTITHETLHGFVAHFRLVQACEGGHFDLRLVLGMASQAKSSGRRMPNVPEIVASLLGLHVDARGVLILCVD